VKTGSSPYLNFYIWQSFSLWPAWLRGGPVTLSWSFIIFVTFVWRLIAIIIADSFSFRFLRLTSRTWFGRSGQRMMPRHRRMMSWAWRLSQGRARRMVSRNWRRMLSRTRRLASSRTGRWPWHLGLDVKGRQLAIKGCRGGHLNLFPNGKCRLKLICLD